MLSCLLNFYYFDVCTVHLVQFIIQTKKCICWFE